MDLKEIEDMLVKLQKVGTATCEQCSLLTKFSEIETISGTFLCPNCFRKFAWKSDNIVELPADPDSPI